jgi:hypothetical protein
VRKPIARGLIGAAALSLGLAMPGLASAADPVKPDLGAGPHRDGSSRTSGEGEKSRQPAPDAPVVPKADTGGASTGPSVSPEDERSARDREEDERRATEKKDKMKKRPGYKDDVPAPRASRI